MKYPNEIQENITKCISFINEFRFFLLAEKLNLVNPMFETNCHPIENAIQLIDEKSALERKRLLQMMYNQIEPDLTKIATANKTDDLNCNLTRLVNSLSISIKLI